MSYADIMLQVTEELTEDPSTVNETSTFILRGPGAGTTGTPSARDLKSVLAAKGLTQNEHFTFHGPFKFEILNTVIDADILDHLRIQSALQIS